MSVPRDSWESLRAAWTVQAGSSANGFAKAVDTRYDRPVGANIPLPTDADGRMARVCPSQACSPGYFKVTPGTGIVGGQTIVYCPYCRGEAERSNYLTESQMRFAKDVMMREAHEGIGIMVKEALGVGQW